MRFLTLFVGLALLVSCSGDGAVKKAHLSIPRNQTPAQEQVLDPIPIRNQEEFPQLVDLNQIMILDRCIRLETKDENVMGYTQDLARLGDNFFVIGRERYEVFRFADDGSYLGRVGRLGDGPGEYGRATALAVKGDQLVVLDSARNVLSFFDQEGVFQSRINLIDHGIIANRELFFVDEWMYLADFSSHHQQVPKHLILGLADNDLAVLYGFGDRTPVFYDQKGVRRRGVNRRAFAAFEKVGGTVWCGDPIGNIVEVFDLEGRFHGKLMPGFKTLDAKTLVTEIRDDLEFTEAYSDYHTVQEIIYVDPYVLVVYTQGRSWVNVFDTRGRLLKKKIEFGRSIGLVMAGIGIDEGFLVPQTLSGWDFQHVENKLGDKLHLLLESGFDPENFQDDNPYLFIYKSLPIDQISNIATKNLGHE